MTLSNGAEQPTAATLPPWERLLAMENEAGAPLGADAEAWHDEMREHIIYLARCEQALRAYADARNWSVSRDDLNLRVVAWIGPGAEEKGLPNAMQIAREALSDA